MSAGYAPCSCQQAEELTARVRELEELVETATAELDKRDTHLAHLRDLLRRMLARSDGDELSVGCPDRECSAPGCLDMMARAALKGTT